MIVGRLDQLDDTRRSIPGCDVVGLLCIREAMEGGDSLLVSTVTLYNQMRERHPDLVEELFKPVATDSGALLMTCFPPA